MSGLVTTLPSAPGPVAGALATADELLQLTRAWAYACHRPQDLSLFERETLSELARRLRTEGDLMRVTAAEMLVVCDLLAGASDEDLAAAVRAVL